MSIKDLYKKRIAILGLGIENYTLIKFLLKKKADCEITICDRRKRNELEIKIREFKKNKNVKWQLGEKIGERKLQGFDILFRSPGGPISKDVKAAIKVGAWLSSPMGFFFNLCPTKNIIGVTGTKGKGTTSSLIATILKQAKKKVWLGGNIGVAPFEFLEKIKRGDWVVLELSSFQLEDLKVSPHISVITNFYSEHLSPADPNNPNYHKSLKEYREAKLNIIKWQKKTDYAVLNSNLESKIKNFKTKGEIKFFTKSELSSKLIGEHNKENVAAAIEVAGIIGLAESAVKKAVAKFRGLEHRLELVAEKGKVKYYNDSFATTPESAITALKSFAEPVILLAGGADKGSNFKKLAQEIKRKAKITILFAGEATPRIKKELLRLNYPSKNIKLVYNMKEAMAVARKNSLAGDVILLSPGCASFGVFKNYKERGKLFKAETYVA